MKKNKILLASLLTLALVVTGCSKETTKVPEGDKPIGDVDGSGTSKTLQKLYEELKESSGGSVALDVLTKRIAALQYKDILETPDADKTFKNLGVRAYRTKEAFIEDIEDNLESQIESTNYQDKKGKFDEEKFVEFVEDEGYTVDKSGTPSKYIDMEELTYNYDEFIEETIIETLYVNYLYEDYLLGTSKYWTTIRNQYGIQFQVLKFENYTTAQNSHFSESLRADVNTVLTDKSSSKKFNKLNNALYSFMTSDSDDNLIVFDAPVSGSQLTYTVYENNEQIDTVLDALYDRTLSKLSDFKSGTKVGEITYSSLINSSTKKEEFIINSSTTANDESFYETIEKISIARKLYVIDTEVAMARNFDLKNAEYEAYRPSQKDNAESFASTYSSTNSRTIKEGARVSKMDAEKLEYYQENKTYTRDTYGSVLPSAISALRGTNARELLSNVKDFGDGINYLLPDKEGLNTPIYADTEYYYVVKVNGYYGYYASQNYTVEQTNSNGEVEKIQKTAAQNVTNYQIESFQEGAYSTYTYNDETHRFNEDAEKVSYDTVKNYNLETATEKQKEEYENWESIIDMCHSIATQILSNTHKTEALVEMFEDYELEINDQDIYDYIKDSYPDYFEKTK